MIRIALFAVFFNAATWSTAFAQAYPHKPVRLIVPFSAGGPADLLGRLIGEKLQRSVGQTIVVINKDGAGTILGVDMAAKASPDGYTLLLGNVAMVISATILPTRSSVPGLASAQSKPSSTTFSPASPGAIGWPSPTNRSMASRDHKHRACHGRP